MLRKGVGSEATKANLKRVKDKAPDRSRGAKITAKNINVNYVGTRTAALPPMVKLEVSDEVSVQEQLHKIIMEHSVKLIDLFREWDDDGDGNVSKLEFRRSLPMLGLKVERHVAEALHS